MGRPHSPDLLMSLEEGDRYNLGKQLARVAIAANLPATYIAKLFGVTRVTLHYWYRGGAIRAKKWQKIKNFIYYTEDDMTAGILPAKTLKEAKEYFAKYYEVSFSEADAE